MSTRWFWSTLLAFVTAAALQGQSRESILKSVTETSRWSPADKPTQYDEKNIETIAGKRAATLRRYGFVGTTTQNWKAPDANVRVILYEMADASAAYGLFTLERAAAQPGPTSVPVGTEGFRAGNRVVFWQSKYLVILEGLPASAVEFARIIGERILGRSRKPPVSQHLPPENLIQGTDRYVVDEASVGRELGLDPGALGFDDSVEIATADYRVSEETAHLVLLMYPTQQVAKKYEDQWASTSNDAPAFRKRVGPLIALVRGLRDPTIAKSILDGVNYESQVTWDQPRPDLSLRQVILTIFTFIGIALLFTLIAGFSFGGLRLFVKARYPNRVFDRPEDMEIIQLKLTQGVTRKELSR